MEEDPILVLLDLCRHFKEGENHRRGLGLGQCGVLSCLRTQGMVQGIGRPGEQQTHSIGQEGGRRGAIAVAVRLDRLAIVFAIPAGAIEVFVEHLGCGRLKRGHHKAWVIARPHDFGLEHHPPWLRPGPRGIDELVIEAAPGRRCLVMGLGERDPLVMEPPRLLDDGSGLAEQDGIASEPKDTIGPASMRDHLDHLWRGNMTLATDKDVRVRPVVTQIRQEPGQDHRIFCPTGTGARAQGGRDQGVRGPCKNEDWEIAMVLIVMIIEGKLLLTMRGIIGVVHIEDKGGRGLGVAGDAVVHQGACETIQIFTVHLVLQTGERGGTRSVVLRLQGTPLHPEFEQGVMAEVIGVIRVRIS